VILRETIPRDRTQGIAVGLVALILLALTLMHFVTLNGHTEGVRRVISGRLGVPVDIAELRYVLLPYPRLTLQGVALGASQEIKIGAIAVNANPLTLLADSMTLDEVEVTGLVANEGALAMMSRFAEAPSDNRVLVVRRIRLRESRLGLRDIVTPVLDGDITIGEDGSVEHAVLISSATRAELRRKDRTWHAAISGRSWQAPLGPALTFDELSVAAVFEPDRVTLTSIDGRIGRGILKGTARATWNDGMRADGEFSLTGAELAPLLAAFTRDFTATGAVSVKGTFVLQGASLSALFAAPKVDAMFSVERGELNNVDLLRLLQSSSRGGKTRFDTLGGALQVSDGQLSFRKLQLGSAALSAEGEVNVAPNGDLSGRINTDVGTKTVVVARTDLNVRGTVKSPLLAP